MYQLNIVLTNLPTDTALNLCFGGKDFDTICVSCVDKVYKRKVKVRGVNTFDAPFQNPWGCKNKK